MASLKVHNMNRDLQIHSPWLLSSSHSPGSSQRCYKAEKSRQLLACSGCYASDWTVLWDPRIAAPAPPPAGATTLQSELTPEGGEQTQTQSGNQLYCALINKGQK